MKFETSEKAPVFYKYPRKKTPQDAVIENATPFIVYHRHNRDYDGIVSATPVMVIWDVQEWLFGGNCPLSESWDTQPIEQAVSELENSVDENMAFDRDFTEALIERAKFYFSEEPEKLNTNHVNELLKRGEITEVKAEEWRLEYDSQ